MMIRVVAAVCAVFLFVVPAWTAAMPIVTVLGIAALALAAAGMVSPWRWPSVASACLFATDYALALWVTQAPVGVLTPAVTGAALLILLEAGELARTLRPATVGAAVVQSQLAGWLVFGGAAVASASVLTGLARGMAGTIPGAAAPLLAALGALGVVLALAAALSAAARRGP